MGSFTGHGRCASLSATRKDDAFLREHGYTRVPTVVQLMVTTRCPMTCPHCLADDGAPGRDASDAVIAATLDGVQEAGIEELLLTGGEPLVRGDLPALIDDLRRRGLSWSLNTAMSPNEAQRRAMEAHPPGFVAVSLDGPDAIHDSFRGMEGAHAHALEALGWFSSLEGCTVTAGTTVTRHNIRHLDRTLHEVATSGAAAWGLHLLVPEGRAAGRYDLALTRRDLKGLLRFTARRRSVFPVSMADELGYCGEWEPLVRDLPLGCGAGRAMCVILPDGEVVPCTTMDRSESAGNILDRPLMELWTEGFQGLRSWTPEGRCEGCDYAAACQGGCWLQRRRGTECFKDIWQVPGALKTAASVAVCLGMLGGAATDGFAAPPPDPSRDQARRAQEATVEPIGAPSGKPLPQSGPSRKPATVKPASVTVDTIEFLILSWYGEQIPSRGRRPPTGILQTTAPDTAVVPPDALGLVHMVRSGTLPRDPGERLAQVRQATGSGHGSLAFDALLLRVATEAALAGPRPASRPKALTDAIKETLRGVSDAANALRLRIFEEKLDPYLARGRLHLRHRFEMSKAYRPPPQWLVLSRDTSEERWGGPRDTTPEITKEYLARHPWGDHLAVSFRAVKGFPEASTRFQPFRPGDSLSVPPTAPGRGQAKRAQEATVDLQLDTPRKTLTLTLTPGATFTWPDLLQAAWDQHRDVLTQRLLAMDHADLDSPTSPLLLPAVMERLKSGAPGEGPQADELQRWMADFWLF